MQKKTTLKKGRETVNLIRKHGIEIKAHFMFGNLGETKENIEETINFAKSLDLDNASFSITTPFPGTYLYRVAKERGYVKQDTKWREYSPFLPSSSAILTQNGLTREELCKYQRRAFREFYLRPKYIFRKIKQIHSFRSIKILWGGVKFFRRIVSRQETF
jgi:radical SAM superfamily enzyme YgiQ (UPF0313 family)